MSHTKGRGLADVMEEVPGGRNHGWRVAELSGSDDSEGGHGSGRIPRKSLDLVEQESDGAVRLIHPDDLHYSGLVTHRGILHPEEYVDLGKVGADVEDRMGYTLLEIHEVYGAGRPTPERMKRRSEIDYELLGIQEKGGNMSLLAMVLGWPVRPHGECRKMAKALARARAAR